jgi:hypothetical protein
MRSGDDAGASTLRPLHIDCLVETKYPISPKIPINAVRCCPSARMCNARLRLTATVFRRIGDVGDEDKTSRLD